jgi:hypothetical protein
VAPISAMRRGTTMLYAWIIPLPGLLIIFLGSGSAEKKRNRLVGLMLLCLLMGGLLVLPGCGGGNGGGGGGTGGGGTPAGAYTITITGKDAGGATQTGNAATVSITVN